eukprot:CAMPEP_0170554366 /NCGR_PEP_ID=MMETSP0211-20121228/12206_1 /TAXON_ID=311385 /ORGANISM="Pseudokeronopsis sp., Strain OXSARD2" /LENGTH=146 /DNA_ID=CAMNT_0010863345 /DNA_START=447 /DNA_END=887 /DNA_ORIENTATION=+
MSPVLRSNNFTPTNRSTYKSLRKLEHIGEQLVWDNYQKYYGSILTTRNSSSVALLEGYARQENKSLIIGNQHPLHTGGVTNSYHVKSPEVRISYNKSSMSPQANPEAFEKVYTVHKLNKLIPVKKIFPFAKEVKLKTPYEHKELMN